MIDFGYDQLQALVESYDSFSGTRSLSRNDLTKNDIEERESIEDI